MASQDAPLCLWCHKKPVTKGWGSSVRKCQRLAGGKARWRNFCSIKCSTEHMHAHQTPQSLAIGIAKLRAFNRQRTVEKASTILREVFGEPPWPIPIADGVKLYRAIYTAGAKGRYAKRKRLMGLTA